MTQTRRVGNADPVHRDLLSFLWPGLGQWYAGSGRSAVIFALPVVAVALVALVQAAGGAASIFLSLIDSSTALTILVLIGLLGLWRIIAMGDALTTSDRGPHGADRSPWRSLPASPSWWS